MKKNNYWLEADMNGIPWTVKFSEHKGILEYSWLEFDMNGIAWNHKE